MVDYTDTVYSIIRSRINNPHGLLSGNHIVDASSMIITPLYIAEPFEVVFRQSVLWCKLSAY